MTLLDSIHRRRKRPDTTADGAEPVNSVAVTVHSYKERTRGKLAEDMVEHRAKELQAENSFQPWTDLTEVDKELWCHMARLEIMGDPTAPLLTRRPPT